MRKVANQRVTNSLDLCYFRLRAISTPLIPLFLLITHFSLKFKQHSVTLCSASSTPAWASMFVLFLAGHFLLSNYKSSQFYPWLQLRMGFQAVPAAVSMDCLSVCLSLVCASDKERRTIDFCKSFLDSYVNWILAIWPAGDIGRRPRAGRREEGLSPFSSLSLLIPKVGAEQESPGL